MADSKLWLRFPASHRWGFASLNPCFRSRPFRLGVDGRHDLALMTAESDEIFVLSTAGTEETEESGFSFGRQDLPVDTSETPIVITEFMAFNTNTLFDEDGDPSDWIEVYNRSDEPVSLGQWFLSDNRIHPIWQFPDITLAPGEFKLVFASAKNRRDPMGELHSNFRLSTNEAADLETLSLWEGGEKRQIFPAKTW